jgi:hypothetical protein
MGYMNESVLFFGEKSLLAWWGNPPHLANVFFVEPTLIQVVFLFFYDPLLASAFIGAILITILLFKIKHLYEIQFINLPFALTLTVYLLLSPDCLFLFSQNPFFALQYSFILYAAYFLRKYYVERVSADLLYFGICLALLVTVSRLSWLIVLAFLPAMLLVTSKQKRPMFAIILIALFPTIFLILTGLLMDTIYQTILYTQQYQSIRFMSTPFHTYGLTDPLYIFGKVNSSNLDKIQLFLHDLRMYFPFMLPYWFFWFFIDNYATKIIYISFLIIPLVINLMKHFNGIYIDSILKHTIYVLFTLVLITKTFSSIFIRKKWITTVLILCYMISFSFSVFFPLTHQNLETRFANIFLGKDFDSNIKRYQEVLNTLKGNGPVLMDDTLLYPIVYLAQDPQRFILPYEDQFRIAISNPTRFAEYIVLVKDPRNDALMRRYPDSVWADLPGFKLINESDLILVFQRNPG